MKKRSLLILLLISGSLLAQPQSEERIDTSVLFTVENDTVSAGEYMAVYNKNRSLGEDIDPKTPLEYLDLYINFKLKVHNAKELGLDTVGQFIREYTTYRNQLAKPYLSDREVANQLIHEAYNRMKYDVRVSHILLAIPEGSEEIDYTKAKAKMQRLRERALNGEDFSELARQYSADTYSAERGGDLGYFTVFNMLYPFESVAYELEEGEISEPVRTRFGYHIIKKIDERPARGMIDVSHIMVVDNENMDPAEKEKAEQKIQEIYTELKNGADFSELARLHSDDKSSASSGGQLQPFGINKMFPEFEEAAFSLDEPGNFSEPFKTQVGWHIVKLNRKENIPPFEEVEREIKNRVERDSRSEQSHESIIKRLKKEYGFREYPQVRKELFDKIDNSYLEKKFQASNIKTTGKTVFEFAGKKYTTKDLAEYLEKAQMKLRNPQILRLELQKAYDSFTDNQLITYEKSRLEEKYPEFRLLAREYYEGILLFNLTEEKVWNRSVTDTTGLQEFFQNNRDKYKWDTRYDAVLVNAGSKKMAKKAMKLLKKGRSVEDIKASLNNNSQLNVSIESGVFEKGEKEELKDVTITGFSDIKENAGRFSFYQVREIKQPSHKELDDVRGLVISDFQSYLEQEWLKELREKYQVNIRQDVMAKVVSSLEK